MNSEIAHFLAVEVPDSMLKLLIETTTYLYTFQHKFQYLKGTL
jgi:hypothetical protein